MERIYVEESKPAGCSEQIFRFKIIEKVALVVYTVKLSGGQFQKSIVIIKALGFGGSVPYAFFALGRRFDHIQDCWQK